MSNYTYNYDPLSEAQLTKYKTANAYFDAASPSITYGRRQSQCSGLTWGYYGGNVTLSSGSMSQIANGTLTLTASSTNYLVASKSTGAVSVSTSITNWNDATNYWRLYSIVTGTATATDWTDARELAKYTGGGGGSATVDWASGRVYHVGQASWMYPTLAAAVTAINAASPAPSSTNRVSILVWPGKYTMTAAVTVPAYVGIKGVSKGLVQLQNNTTDMFICSGNNWFEDFLVEGGTLSSVYAFDCNNTDRNHIRRVDMLNNGGSSVQKFLKQVGSTWKVLFIEDVIVDYYATSGYAVFLDNTSGAARFCDTIINNVFFDSYQLTGYGGSFQLQGVQDVRFRNSTIRGAATWNTGIRHELGGVTGTPEIHVRNCHLEGGVPIYNEASTLVYLKNSSAFGSIFDGTASIKNSYVAESASVAVTGSDITLKGHEHCAPNLTTTGVLTGNRNVIVPTDWKGKVYCNNTGAFTTTIKTSGGSGVVVGQGKRAFLSADGTNVVRDSADV